jgi:hypothetical protein
VNFHETKGALARLAIDGMSLDLAALSQGLELMPANRHSLAEWLGGFIEDEQSVGYAASHSYLHANGFDKIILISNQLPFYKLRLHIWNGLGGPSELRGHIHNHRWSFASRLIMGKARHDLYEERTNGEMYYKYDYLPSSVPGAFTLRTRGTQTLERLLSLQVTAGATYSIHHSAIHRVIAMEPMVSIVLQGAAVGDGSTVFSTTSLEFVPSERHSPLIDSSALLARVKDAITLLRGHDSE